jgi:hypothetical protein
MKDRPCAAQGENARRASGAQPGDGPERLVDGRRGRDGAAMPTVGAETDGMQQNATSVLKKG